jgi:hypothetical protein
MGTPIRIDPRAAGLATLVALGYLVLGSPWPLAVGAGLLVLAVKTAIDARIWRRREHTPAPEPGSLEALWLARAELALESIGKLRRSTRSDAMAQRCAAIAAQGDLSIAALRRLAYQATVVRVIARSNTALESTQRELQSRIETSTLGLESVVARLAEIVAIGDGTGNRTPLEELVSELDSLRGVLIETEQLGNTSVHALATQIDEGR